MSQLGSITAEKEKQMDLERQRFQEVKAKMPALSPEEQKMVDDFAGQIDLTNTQAVLQYGAGSQKKIADFSETALSNVRTKDMGEVGQLLRGFLHAQVEVGLLQVLHLGLQAGDVFVSQFSGFHLVSPEIGRAHV